MNELQEIQERASKLNADIQDVLENPETFTLESMYALLAKYHLTMAQVYLHRASQGGE